MSVYVDRLMDHGWRLGPSCHLFADSLDELHEFAEIIGLRRSWFQTRPGGIPHYDLTRGKRVAAVRAGAVELEREAAVAKWQQIRVPALAARRREDVVEQARLQRAEVDSRLIRRPGDGG